MAVLRVARGNFTPSVDEAWRASFSTGIVVSSDGQNNGTLHSPFPRGRFTFRTSPCPRAASTNCLARDLTNGCQGFDGCWCRTWLERHLSSTTVGTAPSTAAKWQCTIKGTGFSSTIFVRSTQRTMGRSRVDFVRAVYFDEFTTGRWTRLKRQWGWLLLRALHLSRQARAMRL